MNASAQGSINPILALLLVWPLMLLSGGAVASDGMSLDERVACQAKLEDIAWRETLWPEANPEPKPARSAILSDAALRARVEGQLRMEAALAAHYGIRISDAMLQTELNRMARNTRAPERLRERFQTLDNDPQRIAECMARPNLARKYLRSAYAGDEREHGELRRRAEAALADLDDTATLSASGVQDHTVVLVRRGDDDALVDAGDDTPNELKLDADAFDAEAARLAEPAGRPKFAGQPELQAIPAPALRETDEGFVHEQVLSRTDDRIEVRSLSWAKRPFENWWSEQQARWPAAPTAAVSPLSLPVITGQTSEGISTTTAADTWRVETYYPASRYDHTAVWTGSEMIVWGGFAGSGNGLATGGRYDPVNDVWTATTTTAAPTTRYAHTAVWTGSEMIVWGGIGDGGYLTTGGRYDPMNDAWTATTTTGAPLARSYHTAVWTGSEMVVWGGFAGNSIGRATGGHYDPANNIWTATTTTGAPTARYRHTAVWTGNEMIVWGGYNYTGALASGARYDPVNKTWAGTTNTNAPTGRRAHTAVWTGSEMIVWGGYAGSISSVATGGRYDPVNDAWTATTEAAAPDARFYHTAVWTGSEMIVWGGYAGNASGLATGGRYDPVNDVWTATAAASVARYLHTAVWTGSEMIVWGGTGSGSTYLATGGRYDPVNDVWTATTTVSMTVPAARYRHTAVWTGSEMIAWGGDGGGNTGGRYNPVSDTWTATAITAAPDARYDHTAVWTGSEMIVWGGYAGSPGGVATGGRYDPMNDVWTATAATGAPAARYNHTAVWTGYEMVVWGGAGSGSSYLATGGRYDPVNDVWTATAATGAPAARYDHTAVWTGSEMIVWGGERGISNSLASGGRYNPTSNTWTATATTAAPAARYDHTAVWTGSEMIVWGGWNNGYFASGGRYDPMNDVWTATATTAAPAPRYRHTAVWTGSEMVAWGGHAGSSSGLGTGGRYDPVNDIWTATATTGAPAPRYDHTAVWTGGEMIVWGGAGGSGSTDSMGVYYPHDTRQSSVTIVHALAPSPSIVGVPVEVTIRVAGATSVPADGSASVMASSGESCTDDDSTPIDATTVEFSCELAFTTAGTHTVVAGFSGSASHGDSTSAGVPHTVLGIVDVLLTNLAHDYDGTAKSATVSTTPPGITGVSVTYEQAGKPVAAPTAAGSYDIVVSLSNANYVLGDITPPGAQLVIAQAKAEITVSDLVQTWDGLPKPVSVTTDPPGLDVLVTYDGDDEAPADVGPYTVEVAIIDPNYTGWANALLQIIAGEAAMLVKVAGDGQTALAGTAVTNAPQVRVEDGGGNPVEGVIVNFAVTAGGGSVTDATVMTDASGLARVGSWTLGAAGGFNALTVSMSGSSVAPVMFTATATTQVDATVSVTAQNEFTRLGAAHDHLVVVRNDGATLATGLAIEVPLPIEHDPATANWLCQPAGGASCPAMTGTGAIGTTADLPAGASLTFLTFAQVIDVPVDDLITVTAAVTVADDIDLGNNSASASTVTVLFRDGFQPGGDGANSEGPVTEGLLGEVRVNGPSLAATDIGVVQGVWPAAWLALETAQGRVAVIVDRLIHQGAVWVRVRDVAGSTQHWRAVDVGVGVGLTLIQRDDGVALLIDTGNATADVPLGADAAAGLLVLELDD